MESGGKRFLPLFLKIYTKNKKEVLGGIRKLYKKRKNVRRYYCAFYVKQVRICYILCTVIKIRKLLYKKALYVEKRREM